MKARQPLKLTPVLRPAFLLMLGLLATSGFGQQYTFQYGEVSLSDLTMGRYEKDTTANAVYLKEFGEAHIDSENDHNLIFEYHALIKILRPVGVDQADRSVLLYHDASQSEMMYGLRATTYNLEGGKIVSTDLDTRDLFTEKVNENYTRKKFTLPNVHSGSVLELEYIIESPYYYTFRRWEFQASIPKISSEYWATIPANFIYNITLVGNLKLSKNEGSTIKNCFSPNGNMADCARFDFEMDDVPAFIEEDYMTSSRNFLSSINFEISEIKYFDGGDKKFTLSWKDFDNDLDHDDKFGVQLKKGKDLLKNMSSSVTMIPDSLLRARAIFDFIKNHYKWNECLGKYSDQGIKKAFDAGSGNVGDINLSLVAVLQASGIRAIPLILSTRDHGVPFEDNPLLTDYNYVIALVHVAGKDYLLDATDHELPFGMIPERCLNGKGRALADGGSYWYPLKPNGSSREYCGMELSLDEDGNFVGLVTRRYTGYAAYDKRKELDEYTATQDYLKHLESTYSKATISNYAVGKRDSLDLPLVETFQISLSAVEDMNIPVLLFNPFLAGQVKSNPFKMKTRQYPVDFGAPIERTYSIRIKLPDGYQVDNLPPPVNLALPGNSARFVCSPQILGNTLNLSYLMMISKPSFAPVEYEGLREFYSRVVQSEATDVVLKANQ